MKLLAQQTAKRYLIETRKDYGRILDLGAKQYYPEKKIVSLIAFGQWQPYQGSLTAEQLLEGLGIHDSSS